MSTNPPASILDAFESTIQQHLGASAQSPVGSIARANVPPPIAPRAPLVASASGTPRHRLDAIGARWMWRWPIKDLDTAAEITAFARNLKQHGITGVCPQASDSATAWVKRWGHLVRAEGLDLCIGLGLLSARIVCDAIAACKAGHALGVMVDQEEWKSVPDSDALVRDVLREHSDAADWIVDCHYPCLTTAGERGGPTGHHRIAKAWAPICGLRAPQCYWNSKPLSFASDGWVMRRLAWARLDYPRAGGSPADHVRASVQLYRASVKAMVALLLTEGETGSVWLWEARQADASSWLALRIVHALESLGFRGPGAVERFQASKGLATDGLGPITCGALGVTVPAGVVWRKP